MKSIANKTQIQRLYHKANNLYATEYTVIHNSTCNATYTLRSK